jgi:hypothetical protein
VKRIDHHEHRNFDFFHYFCLDPSLNLGDHSERHSANHHELSCDCHGYAANYHNAKPDHRVDSARFDKYSDSDPDRGIDSANDCGFDTGIYAEPDCCIDPCIHAAGCHHREHTASSNNHKYTAGFNNH